MENLVDVKPYFWENRRVLITGHTGFKGSWLTLWLRHLQAKVWGYSQKPYPEPNLYRMLDEDPHVGAYTHHHYEGDLSDIDDLKSYVHKVQPEVVFHLAAQPLVRLSYSKPLETWSTNLQGTLNLLESLKCLNQKCAVVLVTTDKVYENKEWPYGYRETDRLGGYDPYSASKAAVEIAISSWRNSFCGSSSYQTPYLRIATARSGNVIGGGDWATDRIVPDAMRALSSGKSINVRNPNSTRPWQHVLEPLCGYMKLAETLHMAINPPCEPFNFGPQLDSNRSVSELVTCLLKYWPGDWTDQSGNSALHEALTLNLQIDKAHHLLGWNPRWDFNTTVERTVLWYRLVLNGASPFDCCIADINAYQTPH